MARDAVNADAQDDGCLDAAAVGDQATVDAGSLEREEGGERDAAVRMGVSVAPTAKRAIIEPPDGDDPFLEDLLQLKALYANNHLSDVLFVFASDKHTPSLGNGADGSGGGGSVDKAKTDARSENGHRDGEDHGRTPEHHLLPAHRLILSLRSGTFASALLRTKSSQVSSHVRFPIKIHIQDTPYRVFATLIRFLYTNEVVESLASGRDGERAEFWKELLRASFIYLVPSLVEICVQQIVQMLDGEERPAIEEGEDQEKLQWRSDVLRRILDILVYTDSVLAAKHPGATKRRASKKQADILSSNSAKENGSRDLNGLAHEHFEDDPGLAKCTTSILELQQLCMSKLEVVPDRQFEALVHTDIGSRCSTERLCGILKQRSDTPLVVAIRYQLGRVVNELLKLGEPLDKFNSDESDLPLVAALKTGNDAIIRRLLVDEDAPYFLLTDKVPLFFLACGSGNVLHCQILIDESNAQVNLISQLEDGDKEIMAEFGHGQTPLHIASRKGHAKVVGLLLSNSAASNLQDEEGNTALHCAGNMETAEMLLSSAYKTNPNIPNRRGQTALHVAAARGNVGIVDLLIRNGSQQDIVDDQGQSAFHVAAANGHTAVALILLRENESFERNQTHRRISEKNVHGSGESAEDDTQSGTDDNDSETSHFVVNQEDLKGNTALHLAAMSPSERCQKMIQLLLENGADPNHTNWFGYTPLHLFCSHQSGPDSVIDVFVSDLCGKMHPFCCLLERLTCLV